MSDPTLVDVPFALLYALEAAIQALEAARRAVILAYQREPWDGPLAVHEARAQRDEAEKTVQDRVTDLLNPYSNAQTRDPYGFARLVREEKQESPLCAYCSQPKVGVRHATTHPTIVKIANVCAFHIRSDVDITDMKEVR